MKPKEKEICLSIYVKPNSKKSALLYIKEGIFHIALHAKPVDGEANSALIYFLSDLLGVPQSQIILKSGKHSRYKKVIIPYSIYIDNKIAALNIS